MPPLPVVPSVVKIIVKQSLASVSVYNVLHAYESSGSFWTTIDMQALANAVRSSWVTNVLPLQHSALTLGDVQVVDLSSETGGEATATGTSLGTAAGAASPANACVCWSWKISRRYRGGHPRTYIAGLATGNVLNANSITPTHRTAHATAAAALRTAINAVSTTTGNAQLCTVHYRRANAQLAIPLVSVINSVSVDDRIDSQRRRLGRDR